MKDNRTVEEQAEDAAAFCNGVLELAREHRISEGVMLTLFGHIAKTIIDVQIEEGMHKGDAMQQGVGFIMKGLGFTQEKIENDNNDDYHH